MEGIKYEDEFIVNERGIKLFTCRWLPVNREPKALVFICHGYAMECSITMRGTGTRLAKAGYAVHGIDYEGHGKSSGLQGYIPSFDNLLTDCDNHFINICEKRENKGKMRYLLGESMGGAVAILLHRRKPTYWDGAILVAPMCKIADEMKPPRVLQNCLQLLTMIVPTWKIVPTEDIVNKAIKSKEWRDEVRSNPYCYKGRPRLRTGFHLLTVSLDIEKNLDKVSLPFIIVHGGDDKVTDPSVSRALYGSSMSKDKTLKLYSGMWHALTSGEPKENIDMVFKDIIEWIDKRSTSNNSLSEGDFKNLHDKNAL